MAVKPAFSRVRRQPNFDARLVGQRELVDEVSARAIWPGLPPWRRSGFQELVQPLLQFDKNGFPLFVAD